MTKYTLTITILLLFFISIKVTKAQVGISSDNSSPETSAMLDIKSISKGLLIPRMTTIQRTSISSPATGLMVFDIDTGSFWFYTGASWSSFITNSYWSLNGNDVYNSNTSNKVGIATSSPQASLDVNGTIIAAAQNKNIHTTLTGGEGIVMTGGASDYLISVQDGNGRIQHKWNASTGVGETFLVGNEDAVFIDVIGLAATDSDNWLEFKHADGALATAGDPISWNTQLVLNQGGLVGINEANPIDYLHITSADVGTRARVENSSNGYSGYVAKNTLREWFIGAQGSLDTNHGEFHIFDNTAGAQRFVIDATGAVGIGKGSPSVKLDVNGSVNCTGGTCSSDIRWKRDVQSLGQTLPKLTKLQGVYYYWKTAEFPHLDFDKDRQIGLIAQEVEKIYPELVKTNNEGYKSLDYMSLTAILLEGVKEQQSQLAEKGKQIKELKKQLTQLKNNTSSITQRIKTLEDMLNVAMKQE